MEILIYILKIKIDLFVVEIRLNELKYFFILVMIFRICFFFILGVIDSNYLGIGWVV